METFALTWGRSWIIRAFGRSPLVRMSDRVEALVLVSVFAAALMAVPVAATIGTTVHDSRAQSYAQEQRDRRPLTATVIEDATATSDETRAVVTAPVRWRVDGVDHVETVPVDPGTKVDDPTEVWVDVTGHRVGPPTPTRQAGFDALVAGTTAWLAVVGGLAGLWASSRVWLTRRRAGGWDRELRELVDDDSGRTGRSRNSEE